MRVHSTHDATPHFPFLWDEPYASLMRVALNMRYQLLPYHYSLAHRLYATGQLWMRTLAAAYPNDTAVAELTNEWLDGELLVAPILSEDNTYSTYLPAGTWFRLNSVRDKRRAATVMRHIVRSVRLCCALSAVPPSRRPAVCRARPLLWLAHWRRCVDLTVPRRRRTPVPRR
jgi:hypothetical protein